jgi:hypothetical protein
MRVGYGVGGSRAIKWPCRMVWASFAVALAGSILISAPPTLASGSCPNEGIRGSQQSTALPDCRAYELVTPTVKDSGEPEVEHGGFFLVPNMVGQAARAAENGGRFAWNSEYSLPGSSSAGLEYLSTRGEDGWSSGNVVPPQSTEGGVGCPFLVGVVAWSADLSQGVLADGDAQEPGHGTTFAEQGFECGHDEPLLAADQPEGFMEREGLQNLFLQDEAAQSYALVNATPITAPVPRPASQNQRYFYASFLAGSSDLSHVVFEEELPLVQAAEKLTPRVEEACAAKERECWEGHDELYEWREGETPAVRLVSILPDGAPVQGTLAGATKAGQGGAINVANFRHAVSADGARIFFEAQGSLYVREDGTSTSELDALQHGSGAAGGGKFMAASAEGTRVLFTDESRLSPDAKAEAGKPDLYEYDFHKPPGERLSDLTAAAEPADVLGLGGISEDGSYLYFVADGSLTAEQRNSVGAKAEAGQPNLYLLHEGITTFIATLAGADSCDWASNAGCESGGLSGDPGLTARVSGNGAFIGFNSTKELTGYHNTDAITGNADEEIFLYEAAANRLACVSCNPEGPPSAGGAAIRWPGPPDHDSEVSSDYPQRNVSNGGQVFFETAEALVSQDANGQRDVYEFEAGGLHLISSGISEAPSYFMDATPSGSDVFFGTAQPLLERDQDDVYDIYDARVDGGFPEPALPALPCSGEGCRSAPQEVPALESPASATLSEPGNLTPSAAAPKLAITRKPLTRAQKLAKALKACARKRGGRARKACRRAALERYGSTRKRAPRRKGAVR